MPELTPQQVSRLEGIRAHGFEIVAFPLYASYIGIKKGNCAALLAAAGSSQFRIFGAPSYLVAGNIAVQVTREGKEWFVWKQRRLEATRERQDELTQFSKELSDLVLTTI